MVSYVLHCFVDGCISLPFSKFSPLFRCVNCKTQLTRACAMVVQVGKEHLRSGYTDQRWGDVNMSRGSKVRCRFHLYGFRDNASMVSYALHRFVDGCLWLPCPKFIP